MTTDTTAQPEPQIARDRDPEDACQRGTTGCCIDHSNGYDNCETW